MEDTSMSMNHALSSHLMESFEQSRRVSTPPFGGHGLTAANTSTQLGFFPLSHGNFSQMSSTSSFSADRLAEMQAKLNKKLGPEFISQRPGPGGGAKLTYAEGWKIINLANEVFGFNGWSSSVMSITTDYIDHNPETNRYNVGVSALVRVTLRDGAFHEDVGFGALENARGKGMALDKCKKEAVTDAIKRTLRNFGNVLGNCLYDKQYVSEIAKVKAPVVKLDQGALHRRPDLAGPVPNMPPRESTPQPVASTSRNPPAQTSARNVSHPTGNPSPLATSTPITNRTLGNELPTPDTSAIDITVSNSRPPLETSAARNTSGQNSRTNNVPVPAARASSVGSTSNRVSPPAPGSNAAASAPRAQLQRTNSEPNNSDVELAGELPADGSVYGGSEDDAFFDNILPGELDMDVADVPAIPPRAETPQNSKPERQDPTVQTRPTNTSGSAGPSTSTRPARAAAGSSSDPSNNPRPAKLRLADAIRGGAPGGAGFTSGDKRASTSDPAGQKRQRTT